MIWLLQINYSNSPAMLKQRHSSAVNCENTTRGFCHTSCKDTCTTEWVPELTSLWWEGTEALDTPGDAVSIKYTPQGGIKMVNCLLYNTLLFDWQARHFWFIHRITLIINTIQPGRSTNLGFYVLPTDIWQEEPDIVPSIEHLVMNEMLKWYTVNSGFN